MTRAVHVYTCVAHNIFCFVCLWVRDAWLENFCCLKKEEKKEKQKISKTLSAYNVYLASRDNSSSKLRSGLALNQRTLATWVEHRRFRLSASTQLLSEDPLTSLWRPKYKSFQERIHPEYFVWQQCKEFRYLDWIRKKSEERRATDESQRSFTRDHAMRRKEAEEEHRGQAC